MWCHQGQVITEVKNPVVLESVPVTIHHRSVSHGIPDAVTTIHAIDFMSAKVVEDQSPCLDVQTAPSLEICQQQPQTLCQPVRIPSTIASKLHKDVWARKLRTHPDQKFVSEIVGGIETGVPILYDGPILNQSYPNWNSCVKLREEVKTSMLYDIARNWKVGPFSRQPFKDFVSSPMGVFTKLSDNNFLKVRVIHDLSWPPEGSVNYYIPSDPCTVHYVSVDTAVAMVKEFGVNCQMAKLDLRDAYKQIAVRREDWPLLGSSWVNDYGDTEFYFDMVLPFGCRSSAAQFDKYATALEYMMKMDGVTSMCHYLDDMLTCGRGDSAECLDNLNCMMSTCKECSVDVNPRKTVMPTTCIEFLGLIMFYFLFFLLLIS
jgi:hypothetical protein